MNIKHNHIETLKRIQQRYKFKRTETKRQTKHCTVIGGDNFNRHIIRYYTSRNIPLSIKRIEDIVFNENESLDCLLDGIVDDEGYEVTLIVEVNLFVRYHQDDEFNIRYLCFHSDEVVDNVTKYNIEGVLAAHQEIYSDMDEDRNRMNFEGVQNIRFKLIIDKPV